MNKFVYKNSSLASQHWELCNKEKLPFITINSLDKYYSEIFYDITDINNNLEEISEFVKEIFSFYNKFFCMPGYITEKYNDQYYYFEFPVQKDHAEFIANQLFDYLQNQTSP